MKKHTVKLTTVQIIALSKAVQAACWSPIKFKGFGRVRKNKAIQAVSILEKACL